ncbi:DUF6737 family protein [Phormidesmis sp. 146-12]
MSVWNYKPWWCQPWSIGLTGVTAIAASWLLFKLIWLTVLVAIPMVTWMGFFILVYPRMMQASLEEYARSSSDENSIE